MFTHERKTIKKTADLSSATINVEENGRRKKKLYKYV